MVLLGISASLSSPKEQPESTAQNTKSQQQSEEVTPRGVDSIEAEVDEVKYEVIKKEDSKLADNIWVLIEPDVDGEKATRAVKENECSKPCFIQIFDDKQAYLKDLEYNLLLGSGRPNVQDDLTAWKVKNYVFVADHLVGWMLLNDSDEYNAYPMRDWYYDELKNQ